MTSSGTHQQAKNKFAELPAGDWRVSAAATASGAFAWGCLLTQLVTVPAWRRAETGEARLRAFRNGGPTTGAVLFPVEVAAAGLLSSVAWSRLRTGDSKALPAGLAAVAMMGTIAMLPLYFAKANRQLLDPACPPVSAASRLDSWRRWNWARTGLGVVAVGLAVGGR